MLPDADFKAFKIRVGERVRIRRKDRGLLLKQLAGEAVVSDDTIERLESGAAMTLELLHAVGRVLGVPVAELVAEKAAPVDDARRETINRVVNILRQLPEQDTGDVLAIVERVRSVRARAKRR